MDGRPVQEDTNTGGKDRALSVIRGARKNEILLRDLRGYDPRLKIFNPFRVGMMIYHHPFFLANFIFFSYSLILLLSYI